MKKSIYLLTIMALMGCSDIVSEPDINNQVDDKPEKVEIGLVADSIGAYKVECQTESYGIVMPSDRHSDTIWANVPNEDSLTISVHGGTIATMTIHPVQGELYIFN